MIIQVIMVMAWYITQRHLIRREVKVILKARLHRRQQINTFIQIIREHPYTITGGLARCRIIVKKAMMHGPLRVRVINIIKGALQAIFTMIRPG